jgi:hypothetical protein
MRIAGESLEVFNREKIQQIRLLHELDLSWSVLMQESGESHICRGLFSPCGFVLGFQIFLFLNLWCLQS